METFDYIVVGAGAAGCTLAARLSEDPAVRVLLLEAGPHDRRPEVRLPAAFPKLFDTRRDWAFETAPQAGLGGRRVFFPRGRMLGGCTSMNAMVYTRPHPSDLAAWADEAGAAWGAAALAPLLSRVESTLAIAPLRDPNPMTRAFLRAAPDAGLAQVTQRRGRRFSAAEAYLRPARRRPNLAVRTGALVFDLQWAEARRVAGLAYRRDGRRVDARARREVILSAGAIGTPHLLQRAGIGPAEHLQAHGVGVRHALPGVGQGLVDHPLCPIVFGCRATLSLMAAESPRELARFVLARRGMLTSNVAEAVAFLRTHRGLDGPDLELMFAPVAWTAEGREPPARHGFSLGLIALAPASRGQVALVSPDPDAAPAIRPGYLTEPADVRVLLHGLGLARRIAAQPSLQAFGDVAELGPTAGAHRDEDAAAALREVAQTLYHPAGTCRMGADALAVVDPQLRVHGLAGLRVADASVLPTLPRAHPQCAVHLVAERAAELLSNPAPAPPPATHVMQVPTR